MPLKRFVLFFVCIAAFAISYAQSSTDSIYFKFTRLSDTVDQMAGIIPVVAEIYNPTADSFTFIIYANQSASTAIQGNGNDYIYVNKEFKNGPGITRDTVYINVLQNQLISATKKVVMGFINLPANAEIIPDSTYTLYITNNNVLMVSFLGAAYSFSKDTPLVEVKVVLSTYWPQLVTANVTLAPGSAVYGTDYLFNDTTVVFPPYSSDTQGVWVTIINNNIYESNKQINFNLTNPTGGAILGTSGFTLTIINNDSIGTAVPLIDFENGLKVFPNPASNQLNVQSEKILNRVEIRDMLGNVAVSTGNLMAGKNNVNISMLPSGMYFISILSEDKIYSRPFIKSE